MEFREVMKQWRRFCKSHSNCGECEFNGKGICGEAHLSDVSYADIELRIMAWAAENPESVYPTWYEWLKDMGLTFHDAESSWIGFTERIHHPIPADIAQKLGIEPKEVT